jgi:hypothetical protein
VRSYSSGQKFGQLKCFFFFFEEEEEGCYTGRSLQNTAEVCSAALAKTQRNALLLCLSP